MPPNKKKKDKGLWESFLEGLSQAAEKFAIEQAEYDKEYNKARAKAQARADVKANR
jgi:hypothetical protein